MRRRHVSGKRKGQECFFSNSSGRLITPPYTRIKETHAHPGPVSLPPGNKSGRYTHNRCGCEPNTHNYSCSTSSSQPSTKPSSTLSVFPSTPPTLSDPHTSSSDSLSESTAHCRRAPAAPPPPSMDESESESESDSEPEAPDSWAQNLDAMVSEERAIGVVVVMVLICRCRVKRRG